jgi:hypothetical protein
MLQEGEGNLICGQAQNNVGRRIQWHKLAKDPCNYNTMKNSMKKQV